MSLELILTNLTCARKPEMFLLHGGKFLKNLLVPHVVFLQ